MLDNFASADIQRLFEAADTDGSGQLSVDEFFNWSLSLSAQRHGSRSLVDDSGSNMHSPTTAQL